MQSMEMSEDGRDNGAQSAPTKKLSKKKILKELKEALEKNNELREKVTNLTSGKDGCFSSDSSYAVTRQARDDPLHSTMGSWTLGSLNIPICTPSEGETEIDKRAYEYWKEILVSSLQLVNAVDEQMKFGVFKIKSGPKLREIFQTTSTGPGMPDEETSPFSNALARIDEYYGSRTYTLSQRGKLMMLMQSTTESSIAFVRRVASAAKLCNYGAEEEMEAVVRVVTKGASDGRVRVLAHRTWVKQGTIKDLMDLVRDREIEKTNEEEFQRIHGRGETSLVAAVSQNDQGFQNHPAAFNQYGKGRRFERVPRGGRVGRGFRRENRFNSISNCWRCGSIYHQASDCFAIKKECRVCRKLGHIARVCPTNRPSSSQVERRPFKRRAEHEETAVERKIAAIEGPNVEADLDVKVRVNDEDIE
ncbi:uncharacterized protein LOC134210226 [Armigeres subalbatus]|uniref:uncharacterized protein LOC134210226 n=1 Tax=Armigeres subalbatus TaxID=124917 RepID=UPI002ED3CDDD